MTKAGGKWLLVDGNNLIGATAAGWWRDPPCAVRALLDRLRCYAAVTGEPVELVLDYPQPDLPEGDHGAVVVRYATRRGRDAADDRIVELLEIGKPAVVEVVTSDHDLAEQARRRGAGVTGAGRFLARLDGARAADWSPCFRGKPVRFRPPD
jgi:predicted RNA-binding protein with PIN domain